MISWLLSGLEGAYPSNTILLKFVFVRHSTESWFTISARAAVLKGLSLSEKELLLLAENMGGRPFLPQDL